MRLCRGTLCVLVAVGAAQEASAVIVYNDPDGQTTAPNLADPTEGGWGYVGSFHGSSAVAIGPNHFISSKHQSGPNEPAVSGTFTLNGIPYAVTGYTSIPNSDLRVWEVGSTLPLYAPLYTGDPTGLQATVIGYGRHTLGAAVTTSDPAPNAHGWVWGETGGESWGSNTVDAQVQDGSWRFLRFDFDPTTGEGTLAANDSGGGLFVQEGGVWKLAGVHYGVESAYNYAPQDAGAFSAAIYEGQGLYYNGNNGWVDARSGPQFAYSMDISYYAGDIQAAVPEPASLTLLASGAVGLMIRRRRSA